MKSSTTVGLFVGVLVTLAAAYYLQTSGRLGGKPEGGNTPVGETNDPGVESKTVPVSSVLDNFTTRFAGDNDLIARRATVFPHVTVDAWDRMLARLKMPSALASVGCTITENTKSISVSPLFVEGIKSGAHNIIILNRTMPQCFVQKNNVPILAEDLINGKNLYEFVGEVTINRVLDTNLRIVDPSLFRDLGIEMTDVAFLTNTEASPLRRSDDILILQVSFHPTTALPDSSKIPPYVPGAAAIHPENIASMAQAMLKAEPPLLKPILVDARDRRNLTAGPTYAGAVQAPIIASSFAQLRFQLGLPTAVIAGAKFDINSLPATRDVPLIIYGNDETDAAPLWVIRNLRLQNYKNLFFVVGGLKAMNQLKQPVAL